MHNPYGALIIFSDLDGSLLDHETYPWEPARPWLERLRQYDVPVIITTSKTVAEVSALRNELALERFPFVAKNGALVVLPDSWKAHADYPRKIFSAGYRSICALLDRLRADEHFNFRGFSSRSAADVASLTGLNHTEARLACLREASEPIQWLGNERQLERFRRQLADHDLSLTEGGRFYHVMGRDVSKGAAVGWLESQYRRLWDRQVRTIGLGDGPNDASMLAKTDCAVIIKGKASDRLTLPPDYRGECYRTEAAGPVGWSEGLNHFLG